MTALLYHLIRILLRLRPRPHPPPLSPGARARDKQELMEAARQEHIEWYWRWSQREEWNRDRD